jgi:hypothetical protein
MCRPQRTALNTQVVAIRSSIFREGVAYGGLARQSFGETPQEPCARWAVEAWKHRQYRDNDPGRQLVAAYRRPQHFGQLWHVSERARDFADLEKT